MRVEIATLGWGLILDKHGNGRQGVTVKLRNLDTTDATVYSAASGGTTLTTTGDLTTGTKGTLPGFMEVETYLLTIDGVTYQVEVVSGRTAGAATPLDDSVTLAKLNSAVKPTGTAAPGDYAVRKLGTGASDAAAGNDSRLSDQRVPTDGSVTAAKVNGSLKPSGSAAAGDEALRALGAGATQAAAGNDSRLPTAGQKNALAGTSGTPGTGNEYLTKADAAVEKVANKNAAGGYAGLDSGLFVISTRRAINPRDPAYGAIGDNNPAHAAADTAGLQAAILAGLATGRRVTPGDGVFHINAKMGNWSGSGGSLSVPFAMEGEGFGCTVFKRTADVRIMDLLGAKGTTSAVQSAIAAGDVQIVLTAGQAAAKGIVAGSLINISSGKTFTSSLLDSVSMVGELLSVKSVAAGATDVLTVYGYIEEDYALVDSPVVGLVTPGQGCYIGGITVQGTSGAGGQGAWLLQYMQDVDIDVQSKNLDGPNVQTQDCYKGDVKVDSIDSSDNLAASPQQIGYGHNNSGASRELVVRTTMHRGRHAYTTNGSANGVPRHNTIYAKGSEMTQAVADTHEVARYESFPVIEAHDTVSIAAKMRAPDWSIGKLIAIRCGAEALYIAPTASGGRCDSIRARKVGMGVPQPGPAVATPGIRWEADDCALGHVDIDGTGGEGIKIVGARPRLEGNGRIANPGLVDAALKRCINTGASGTDGSNNPFSGASDVVVSGRLRCDTADYGVYEHAAGVVSEANAIGRSIATALTNRAAMETLPRNAGRGGQAEPILPRTGSDVSGGMTPIAQRAYGARFIPDRDWSIASIGFIVDVVGASGDTCEVALLDSNHNLLLASAAAVTGKLNTTGRQKITLTGGPYAAKAGVPVYLVLLVDAFTAGTKLGAKASGTSHSMNPHGESAGVGEAFRQASVTTVVGWSPGMAASADCYMLYPSES